MFQRIGLIVVLLLLFALALLFVALNQQRFRIDFAVTELSVSAGLALVIAFAAGLLLGVWWRSHWIARLLAERGRLRHALRLAEARVRLADGGGPADVP